MVLASERAQRIQRNAEIRRVLTLIPIVLPLQLQLLPPFHASAVVRQPGIGSAFVVPLPRTQPEATYSTSFAHAPCLLPSPRMIGRFSRRLFRTFPIRYHECRAGRTRTRSVCLPNRSRISTAQHSTPRLAFHSWVGIPSCLACCSPSSERFCFFFLFLFRPSWLV